MTGTERETPEQIAAWIVASQHWWASSHYDSDARLVFGHDLRQMIAAAIASAVAAAERKTLFVYERFVGHAGHVHDWKIECEALTDADWRCLAIMALEVLIDTPFSEVVGIPRGGLKLASYLGTNGPGHPRLIVDDVLTTGKSMREAMTKPDDIGLVVFARGPLPDRVTALFAMPSALKGGGE